MRTLASFVGGSDRGPMLARILALAASACLSLTTCDTAGTGSGSGQECPAGPAPSGQGASGEDLCAATCATALDCSTRCCVAIAERGELVCADASYCEDDEGDEESGDGGTRCDDTCFWANDETCDAPPVCEAGTDCTDCGGPVEPTCHSVGEACSPGSADDWELDTCCSGSVCLLDMGDTPRCVANCSDDSDCTGGWCCGQMVYNDTEVCWPDPFFECDNDPECAQTLEPCSSTEECCDGVCIDVYGDGQGYCIDTCTSDLDCEDRCCRPTTGGNQVCVPEEACDAGGGEDDGGGDCIPAGGGCYEATKPCCGEDMVGPGCDAWDSSDFYCFCVPSGASTDGCNGGLGGPDDFDGSSCCSGTCNVAQNVCA